MVLTFLGQIPSDESTKFQAISSFLFRELGYRHQKPFETALEKSFGLGMQHLQTSHTGGAGQTPPLAAVLPLLQEQKPSLLSLRPRDGADASLVPSEQQLLFPTTSRSVCDEIGLNWWAALKLYEDGWLSFAPDASARLDETQETELRFVGSLVVAGCDRAMLSTLLAGLPKPYAFPVNKLYFHWAARQWRILPDPLINPEAAFTEWLESLVERGDIRSLRGILELTQDALSRLRVEPGQQEFRSRQ